MKVREIMRKKVVTVSPEDSIVKVLRILSKKRISGVPVVKGKRVVGIITEGDIIAKLDIHTPKIHFATSPDFILIVAGLKSRRSMEEIKEDMQVMKKFKVKDFMRSEVITITADQDIMKAARLLNEHNITRLPVVDKNNKLIG
ncbi:MAG TPA: CBS domain-containing protein, partial [Candidatus Aenigmarchaeota archaeon]|nr:CBS domain-containing protein [Candidatus Aenigmarchaeota archaeon]